MLSPFSDEQLRAAINLAEAYEAWLSSRERMPHFPVDDSFRAGLPDVLQPVFAQLSSVVQDT